MSLVLLGFSCVRLILHQIEMMIVYTGDLIKQLEQTGAEKFHRLDKTISKYTMSEIVYLAFGGAMDVDWLHERQTKIGEVYLGYVAMCMFVGSWVRFIPFTSAWKTTTYRREVEDMIRSIVQDARKSADSGTEEVNLIKTMVAAKDPMTGLPLTDDEIIAECTTFLFAGFDTTALTLSWALYHLSLNPDTMRWLQTEVDDTLGAPKSARNPTIDDIPNLKRVRAVINETLRLHPPAWTLPRWTSEEVKLGTHVVPANTIIEVNLSVIHRNPKYWKKPNEFYPQRWIEEEDASRHPYAFAPFSAGIRNCIGPFEFSSLFFSGLIVSFRQKFCYTGDDDCLVYAFLAF